MSSRKHPLRKATTTQSHKSGGLGGAVRRARKGLALTQTQLGLAAGCGVVFVHQLETGKDTVRLDKLLDVLAVLGLQLKVVRGKPAVSVDEILG